METSSWIALASFFAALLAALYSRWSATAARRQNEISIHHEKLKIFKALLDFRTKLVGRGASIPEQDLTLELYPHVQLAEFYYGDATNAELNKLYTCASEMVAYRQVADSTRDKDAISKMHAQLEECRTTESRVQELMRKELRLVETPLSLLIGQRYSKSGRCYGGFMKWWNCLKSVAMSNLIQASVGVILLATLIVLILNLRAFWHQNALTQTLNQPLCAVKMVKVEKVSDSVIQISVIYRNSGKYVAKDALIRWDVDILPDQRHKERAIPIPSVPPGELKNIALLPEHEISNFLVQFTTAEFNKIVTGYAALRLKLAIEYKDMDNKGRRYSCTYYVTRMAHPEQYVPEVSLIEIT
jgi:hypothetical protein